MVSSDYGGIQMKKSKKTQKKSVTIKDFSICFSIEDVGIDIQKFFELFTEWGIKDLSDGIISEKSHKVRKEVNHDKE